MNILYIVPYVPNKIRVRPYNFIRYLAARDNQVTVLTLSSDEMEEQSAEELRQSCYSVQTFHLPTWRSFVNALSGMVTSEPIQSFFSWHPQLAQHLIDLTQSSKRPPYDVIHIEHLRGVRYGQNLLKYQQRNRNANPLRIPIIWDSVDCISYLFEQAARQSQRIKSRIITSFELPRTRKYEGKMAAIYDRTLVTSILDKDAFLKLTPASLLPERIQVLPQGVDLTYFKPDPHHNHRPDTIVVSGKMSYHANISMVWFLVNKIMPIIWRELPEVKLVVVGKDPPKEISALNQHPNIEVTGYVPDIRPYLLSATVAVAPLTYGAGIQNKVLEAMACGVPVVTTTKAVAAIQDYPNKSLLVADNPENFAHKVLDLIKKPELRSLITEDSYQYVQENHNWSTIVSQLEKIYFEEIDKKNLIIGKT